MASITSIFRRSRRRGGFRIGVAIADKPYGPFKPETTPIEGVKGIDPAVLIDKDGSAYLYYSANKIFAARLKPNMLEIEGEPMVFDNSAEEGTAGRAIRVRTQRHLLPHLSARREQDRAAGICDQLVAAWGRSNAAGVILDEAQSGCWTVHHSIVDYKGQWHLFYHDKDLSPAFDKNRSIKADKLFFNADGTIRKVMPTLRGVGLVDGEERDSDRPLQCHQR